MGKLDEAISGEGFPMAMPEIPDLTVPQQMACAARILGAIGFALDVAGHITVTRPQDAGTMWCSSTPNCIGHGAMLG